MSECVCVKVSREEGGRKPHLLLPSSWLSSVESAGKENVETLFYWEENKPRCEGAEIIDDVIHSLLGECEDSKYGHHVALTC